MSDANAATARPIPWLIGVAALLWLTFNCTRGHEMAPIAKPTTAVAPAVAPQPAPAAVPSLAVEPAPPVEAAPAAATPTSTAP